MHALISLQISISEPDDNQQVEIVGITTAMISLLFIGSLMVIMAILLYFRKPKRKTGIISIIIIIITLSN